VSVQSGPCFWPDLTQLCCPDWDTVDPAVQAQALEFSKLFVWAATGRQYGLCQLTVRPCGRQCSNCPSGWYWDGFGGWIPYIFNGEWKNCWCGSPGGCCTCEPDCRVYLPGPVNSIVSVKVNGAVLPVSGSGGFNYFVLDQQWLVRVDTAACWPLCADQNLGPGDVNAFEVTYLRGLEVPTALAQGTASLACEFAKSCIGAPCRLPSRVTSISRQGVTISFADIEAVLRNGLSGLWELDQLIMAINPYGLKGRTRFYSPDVPEPRQVTWP
jgi:hypothetical protein